MGTSLHFSVSRLAELSEDERMVIDRLVDEFSVDDLAEAHAQTGVGGNWESFRWRSAPTTHVVMMGSVRLPDVSISAFVDGVNHWGRLLGRIRSKVLAGGEWQVHVEGEELRWHAAEQVYAIGDPGIQDFPI